jgi:uncharacterized membrane protein YfcA
LLTAGTQARMRLVTLGLLGGLLSGLLGVGGGVIMVPLLVLWAGVGQRDAHAISLGAVIPISLCGALAFGVGGHVDIIAAAALLAGSMFGAQLGARALAAIDERALKAAFGGFLVVVACLMGGT